MSSLSAAVSGTVQIAPKAVDTIEKPRSGGTFFNLALHALNSAPANEASRQCVQFTSGSYVGIGFPSDLRGKVLYLRMLDDPAAAINVRLTQETTGQTVIANVRGMLLVEFLATDRLTEVEIDGDAKIEWAVVGDAA